MDHPHPARPRRVPRTLAVALGACLAPLLGPAASAQEPDPTGTSRGAPEDETPPARDAPGADTEEGAAEREDTLYDEEGVYHTPLAGEELHTEVFGFRVDIDERDRSLTGALSLGGAFYAPSIGGTSGTPIGALFFKKMWSEGEGQEARTRRYLQGTLGVLVNDVEFSESLGLLGPVLRVKTDHRRLFTAGTEVVDNRELDTFAVEWGRSEGWLGLGLRQRVWPFHVDNDVQLEAFYKAGYLYFDEKGDTDPLIAGDLPRDTYVHGLHVRARLDMFQRNLLELPHSGIAAGADLELVRRDRWPSRDQRYTLTTAPTRSDETRDYLKVSGYFVAAGGVPGLSERHRVMLRLQGGWSPADDLDRFSAFRLGGGPVPKEASDLARVTFPGALFDQFISQRYAVATLEYRYELLFFLYLHLRGSLVYSRTLDIRDGALRYADLTGFSASVALTSGFVWRSQLHISYSFGGDVVRGGHEGHSLLVMWSKSFF